MKKIFIAALMASAAFMTVPAAEVADSTKNDSLIFTTIKEIPITSVKNQARSGTCWNYSTLSFTRRVGI